MKRFGIDEEEIQITDENDRFKRPISVAIFGCLLSAGTIASSFLRSGGDLSGWGVAGVIIFTVFASGFSCLYAYLGWRHSRALANKVLRILGLVLVFGGVAFLVWMLEKYAP